MTKKKGFVEKEIEPFPFKDNNLLYFADMQNQFGFPNPDFVYPLNEAGLRVERDLPSEEMVVVNYWVKKRKTIALIGAVCAFVPFSLLVQETGIFDQIFLFGVDLIMLGVSYFLGLFS